MAAAAAAGDPPETRTFASLYGQDALKDGTLMCCDGKEIRVHKCIVAELSPVLYAAFTGAFRENRESSASVDFPEATVQHCIRAMYLGNAAHTPQDPAVLCGMLEFARYYDCRCLETHADALCLRGVTSVRTALIAVRDFWTFIESGMLQGTQVACHEMVADRFAFVYTVDGLREMFLSLPLPAIAPLLAHTHMCADETPLLLLLNQWASRHSKRHTAAELDALFAHVRVGLMSAKDLVAHVRDHPHIPQHTYYQALRHATLLEHNAHTHTTPLRTNGAPSCLLSTPRPHKPSVRVLRKLYPHSDVSMARVDVCVRRPMEDFTRMRWGECVADTEERVCAVTNGLSLVLKLFPAGRAAADANKVCLQVCVVPAVEGAPWPASTQSVELLLRCCARVPYPGAQLCFSGVVRQVERFSAQRQGVWVETGLELKDAIKEGDVTALVTFCVRRVNGVAV